MKVRRSQCIRHLQILLCYLMYVVTCSPWQKHWDDAGDDRVETPHDGDDDNHSIATGDTSDKHTS